MRRPKLPHFVALVLLVSLPIGALVARAADDPRIRTLQRAADDPGLPGWQRDFYRDRLALARQGRLLSPVVGSRVRATDAVLPVWSRIAETPRRQGQSMIVDTLTDRVIVFGGREVAGFSNDVFVLEPEGDRRWHRVLVPGDGPTPRAGHVAVLDGASRRMLVYGGADIDGSYLADVWSLNLDGAPVWTELSPIGPTPSARANHLAVVDTLNRRVLFYGGTNGGFSPLADLCSLSLDAAPAWETLPQFGTVPTQYTASSLLIDARRQRLALAGTQTINYSTQLLMYFLPLSGSAPAWTTYAPPSLNQPPLYNGYHQFVIDDAADRLLCLCNDYSGFTYSLPLVNAGQWFTTPGVGSMPAFRAGRALAFDAPRRRIFVTGGSNSGASSRTTSDLSMLDAAGLAVWTFVAGEPAPRTGHSLAYDPTHGIVHVFGGLADSLQSGYNLQPSNALWSLSSAADSPAWAPVTATGGPLLPREGAAMVVDPIRDRIVLFGGINNYAATNEVWQRPLSGSTAWTRVAVAGNLPHQRGYAAMTYDPVGDRMLVFGGYDPASGATTPYLADVWSLSLDSAPRWTKLLPSGAGPAPRARAQLVFDPAQGRAYVVGGTVGYSSSPTVRAGEVWRLRLTPAPAWELVTRGISADDSYGNDRTCAAFYDPVTAAIVRVTYHEAGYANESLTLKSLVAPVDTSWTDLVFSGAAPPASTTALGVFDSQARRLVWYGGTSIDESGTWALSFGPAPLGAPPAPPREAGSVVVAPNPVRGPATVRFALPRAGRVTLELLDLAGRRVHASEPFECAAGPSEIPIGDLSRLPAGVYFARLTGAVVRSTRVAVVH